MTLNLTHRAPLSIVDRHLMEAGGSAALAGILAGAGPQEVQPITLGSGLSIVGGALTMGSGGPYVLKAGDTMTGNLTITGDYPMLDLNGALLARITKPSTVRCDLGNAGKGFWYGYHYACPEAISFGGTPTYPRTSLYYDYGTTTNPTDLTFYIVAGNASASYAHNLALEAQGTGAIIFRTGSGTERVRIPGDAGGFVFPATQAASSNANGLDDYEEGTFTVTSGTTNVSVTNHSTYYVKIGQFVLAYFYVTITNNTGAAISAWTAQGLPFTSNGYGPAPQTYNSGGMGYPAYSYTEAGLSEIRISGWPTTLANGNSAGLMFTVSYRAQA